jgi:uracil-DNA glycosylase
VFGHGAHAVLPAASGHAPDTAPLHLFGCYHVSQQNTFTGRLTSGMLEAVLRSAASAAGLEPA